VVVWASAPDDHLAGSRPPAAVNVTQLTYRMHSSTSSSFHIPYTPQSETVVCHVEGPFRLSPVVVTTVGRLGDEWERGPVGRASAPHATRRAAYDGDRTKVSGMHLGCCYGLVHMTRGQAGEGWLRIAFAVLLVVSFLFVLRRAVRDFG
jgi:hypothetical protein